MNNGLDQKEIDKITLNWTEKKLIEWRNGKGIIESELILSSGRLENGKYIEFLKLFPKIVNTYSNIKWIIVGDGPDMQKMKSISEDLNICYLSLFSLYVTCLFNLSSKRCANLSKTNSARKVWRVRWLSLPLPTIRLWCVSARLWRRHPSPSTSKTAGCACCSSWIP